MISLTGKIVSMYLYNVANINPERVESGIPGAKGLDILFFKKPNRNMKHKSAKTKNGTRYEVYVPNKNVHPENVIYYLHGGAYIGKQNWIYRYQSRYFSKAADGATVVYVDYDVAPDYVYPTQLDQAMDVWNEITGKLGFKAENVVCGGDSAGGNLTLGLMLKLRDEGRPMPRGAFCISPCAERYSGRTFWTTAPYPSNCMAYDPSDNFPPFLSFIIKFDEAEAYRKTIGCYLRKNQWEDMTVDVYL